MRYGVFVKAALEKRKNMREMFRQSLLAEVWKALACLAEHVGFDEAVVFGSLVRPFAFSEHSDIDIGFFHLPDDGFFFTIAFLSGCLGRDVDVIQIEKSGEFVAKILKEGVRWTKKN